MTRNFQLLLPKPVVGRREEGVVPVRVEYSQQSIDTFVDMLELLVDTLA